MPIKLRAPERVPQIASSLSREADHRIANSLTIISSLVRLHATAVDAAEDPQTFLMDIADRIDTVGQLHRLIAHSGRETVRLCDHLREICQRLNRALASDQVSFSLACSPEHSVPPSVALSLGLIIAELYSNSLKYAHPAGLPVKIAVSCCRSADAGLTVVYEDDGVGFPEGFDIESDGHLGMRFIRSLSKQLLGTQDWLNDPLGIRFELSIPFETIQTA
jgi:two-component sensor histidine kinase